MTGKPGSGNSGCSAASEHGNNQNSLRDRIAAVLNRHKPDGDRHDEWSDCQCGHVGTRWDDHVADAVIRELGLHRQDNELDTTGPYRHRYVTEWIADD